MSTKIYNGYVLPSMELAELNDFCKNIGKKIVKVRKRIVKEIFYSELTDYIALCLIGDRYINEKVKNFKSWPSSYISSKVAEGESSFKKNKFDVSCKILFFPLSGKILALLYTEHDKFFSLWESQPEVSEYFYFDNTDKPEEIPAREWEQRRLDWDKALENGVPALNGLHFDPRFLGDNSPDFFDSEIRLLKSEKINQIVNRASEIKMRHKWMKERASINDSMSRIMHLNLKFSTFLDSPEGQKLYKRNQLKMSWRISRFDGDTFKSFEGIINNILWQNN